MNEEKEHVAEFTAALFRLTHEPCRKKPINICRFPPRSFSAASSSQECRRDALQESARPAAFLRPGS